MSCSDRILKIEGYVFAQVPDEGVGSSSISKDMGSSMNNRICVLRGFKWTNFLLVEGFLNEAQCVDSSYCAEGISLFMLDLIVSNHFSVSGEDVTKTSNSTTSTKQRYTYSSNRLLPNHTTDPRRNCISQRLSLLTVQTNNREKEWRKSWREKLTLQHPSFLLFYLIFFLSMLDSDYPSSRWATVVWIQNMGPSAI